MWQPYIDDIAFTFRKHKAMAERAVAQISDEAFFHKPGEHSNSIAMIIKHLAGNLQSRFTDFLTTDGDKPWRDRDGEFVIGPDDTRANLMAAWEAGWAALLQTLAGLTENDAPRTVLIRGEAHSVIQAINRAVAHNAYHVGQIVYLARLLNDGDWQWITIAPGKSEAHRQRGGGYLK